MTHLKQRLNFDPFDSETQHVHCLTVLDFTFFLPWEREKIQGGSGVMWGNRKNTPKIIIFTCLLYILQLSAQSLSASGSCKKGEFFQKMRATVRRQQLYPFIYLSECPVLSCSRWAKAYCSNNTWQPACFTDLSYKNIFFLRTQAS